MDSYRRNRLLVPADPGTQSGSWMPAFAGMSGALVGTLVACAFLCVLATAALAALTFPKLTGRVVDEAGIIDPATKAALETKLADFEAKTTGQFVVVTLKSLQGTSIEDFGYQLGRYWAIGQKDKNSGVLLIVAPNEHKVRIEVGYGLEGQLTDAVTRLIIENSILPRFKAGDFVGGINRGVDDVIQALNDPEEWRSRAQQRPDDQSAGLEIIGLFLLFIVLFIIVASLSQRGPPGPGGRKSGSSPVFFPVPTSWGSSSSSSSWSSGGGFSGGGGSFGGGGASGSW